MIALPSGAGYHFPVHHSQIGLAATMPWPGEGGGTKPSWVMCSEAGLGFCVHQQARGDVLGFLPLLKLFRSQRIALSCRISG